MSQHRKHLNKHTKQNINLNQHANLRTVRMCVRIIVHNCRIPHCTEQFRFFSPNLQTVIIAFMLSTAANC